MVSGSFETRIAGRRLSCDEGYTWTEPWGELHTNVVGKSGAHCLVIQGDPGSTPLLPFQRLLDDVRLFRDGDVVGEANRIREELKTRDQFTQLSVDARVQLLLAGSARICMRHPGVRPRWLLLTRDRLHDEWRSVPALADIARDADVHPSYLANAFRRHFGESIGSYTRRLRLTWAVEELTRSRKPISHVALEAGFSDQSHFTRDCKRYTGLTPAAHRQRAS